MVLRQRIEHHEHLLGTLLRRRVSEPGVQVLTRQAVVAPPHVDVPMKIQHGGGPNPECRSAIRHSVAPLCRISATIPAASGLKNRKNENFDPLLPGFYDWAAGGKRNCGRVVHLELQPEVAADPRARDAE